jgi:hypothetical protein
MGLVLLTGCTTTICPPPNRALTIENVIEGYNANAERIPRLWARAEITFQESALALPITADGLLLLNKNADRLGPQDFFLLLKEAGQPLGRVGISTADGAYYMWFALGKMRQCRWGRLALAGASGLADLPIDPVQLLGVLGVCELPADLTRPPIVAQSYRSKPCAYVLTYIDRQPVTNKLLAKREMYFDRSETKAFGQSASTPRPCRPFRVRIFDDRGRAVLTAEMSGYQPIAGGPKSDTNDPPVMPTRLTLKWEDSGSRLRLTLADMTMKQKIDESDLNEAFRFWDLLPEDLKAQAVQIDASYRLDNSETGGPKGSGRP